MLLADVLVGDGAADLNLLIEDDVEITLELLDDGSHIISTFCCPLQLIKRSVKLYDLNLMR